MTMAETEGQQGVKTARNESAHASTSRPPAQALSPSAEEYFPGLFNRHAFNIALLALLMMAMFWRVFFAGETLIDVATLNNQLPWGYYAGVSDYPYNRRDLTDMYVTRDYFVVSAYRDGEMPMWNPYTMAGHPIYADGVTKSFSPFLLFYKFFDVPTGYSLARIVELILAAIFVYIFLVNIGVSAGGALIGSVVFEFSSHSMLHLTGLGWWGGLMWLPLVILFADRALERRSYTQAIIAGVLLAAQFFCGYLPNQIYYVGAVGLYYLFFAFAKSRKLASHELKKSLALMMVTLLVGFTLAATQWVPMLELLRHSNRKIVGAELSYIYLPPWYGLTLIFPNLFGEAYDTRALTLFTALNVSHDHILYLGIAALLPLAFSLYWLKQARRKKAEGRKPPASNGPPDLINPSESIDQPAGNSLLAFDSRLVFFALLALISLVIMMAAPLYVPVTRFIPILQVIRVAVRAGVLFLFAATALIAFGVDLLMKAESGDLARFARLARKALCLTIGLTFIAVAASYLMKAAGFATDINGRGRVAFIRKAAAVLVSQLAPPGLSILIPLAFALMVITLLWWRSKGRLGRPAFFASLIALLVIDLFWASGQFNQTFERSRVYPSTQITDLLRSLPPGRVLVTPSDLETNRRASSETDKIIAPPNTLLPYHISTVSGKNQQFPKWYREFASLIEPQPNLSHVVFDQARSRFFDLLNVRYVMTHASSAPLEGYDLIATAEGIALYENKNAMPRARFADRAVGAQTSAEALEMLRNPATDTVNGVVIETAGSAVNAFGSESKAQRTSTPQATIIEDKRNRVVIETQNEMPGMLVLSDNYYPGWHAAIDGAPVEILKANVTMRAVQVPAGRHMVSFVFMPLTFTGSVYLSLAGAALALLWMLANAVRSFYALRRPR